MISITINNDRQESLQMVLFAFSSNIQPHTHTQTRHTLNNLKAQAGSLRSAIESFANDSNVFRGAAAQAMAAYLTEVHGTILGAWQNVIAYYQDLLERYVRGLGEIDGSMDAVIDLDYLSDFADGLYPLINEYGLLDGEISDFMRNHSEALSIGRLSTPRITNASIDIAEDLTSARKQTDEQREAMGYFDHSFGPSLDDVERMLNGISALSQQNLLGTNSVTFVPGSFRGSPLYEQISVNQSMRDNMTKRYFDAEGNLDHFRVGFTLFEGHDHGLSDLEVQVLLQTFNNSNNSLNDILESYGMAYLIRFASQSASSPQSNGITVSPDEDFRRFVDSVLRAGGMMNGTPPFTSNNAALQQLANASFANFFNEYMGLRNQGGGIPDAAQSNLSDMLSQAQLLAFLNSVGLNAPSFAFDISNLGGADGGHLLFYGNEFHASGINSFTGNGYAGEVLARLLREGQSTASGSSGIWATLGTLGSIGLTVAGYIKGLGPIGKILGGASSAASVSSKINSLLSDNNVNLTQEERSLLNQLIALSVFELGGGVATMQTPNGYVILGDTFARPGAAINVAGLYHVHGITLGDALGTLQGGIANNPERDTIINFVGGNDAHGDFSGRLDDVLDDNRDRLIRLFGTTHPSIASIRRADQLPAEVLAYVIALAREAQ